MIPIAAWIGATRGITGSFLAAFASRDDFRPASLNAVWRRFALVAALATFLFVQSSISLFWFAYALAEVVVTLVAIYTVRRFGDLGAWRAGSRREIASLFREGLSFSALRWSGLLHSRLDIVLIERFLGREAVGIYGAAYRLLDVFKLLPNLAETTLLPIVTRLLGRHTELVESMERSIKALATLSIPLGVGAWIVADLAVRLVFGDAYAGAAYPWALLMASLAVSSIARPALVLLRAQGRLRVANAASWVAVAINLLLNLIWIPRFGILGSAAATAASEVAFVSYSAWLVRNDVAWSRVIRGLVPSVTAAVVMAVTGWGLSRVGLPTLVVALAAALAYGAVLVAARGLDQRDRDGIRMLIQG
jgi:O-antigen/teichoic acid export membrane protein